MKATLFAAPWCVFCTKAKEVLEQAGIEYECIDIDTEEGLDRLAEAFEVFPKSIPQIFINGEYTGGYEDLLIALSD